MDQVGHARRRHYNVGLKGRVREASVDQGGHARRRLYNGDLKRQGREHAQARDSFGIAQFHAVHLLQHLVPDLLGSRTLAHATHPSAVFQDHTTAP